MANGWIDVKEADYDKMRRYVTALERLLDSADDGYVFGISGWRHHLSDEFKTEGGS
jgi:hypothetical protein